MANPYAARTSRSASESQSDVDLARTRLVQAGATPDEVEAFIDRWDDFDEQWTPATRAEWLRQRDVELLRELAAVRWEYSMGTTTEEEAEAQAAAAQLAAATSEAAAVIGGSIPAVLGWVGDDPVRARAARDLEAGEDGQGRTTLLRALDDMIGEA